MLLMWSIFDWISNSVMSGAVQHTHSIEEDICSKGHFSISLDLE